MRRFRVINPRFDTRALLVSQVIDPAWEPHIRAQWEQNQVSIRAALAAEFGAVDFDEKLDRFITLGAEPFSVIAYHNVFLRQCRYAYVMGAFYPSLVAAGALGERILNYLVRDLREDFKSSPHYKKVYDKESFDNWDAVIEVLEDWDVFAPGAADEFRTLKGERNAAVHFNPATDHNVAALATSAISSLQAVVAKQFGLEPKPWFIDGAPHPYIRQESETWPFVRRVLLPSNSIALVGPNATLEFDYSSGAFVVADVGDDGDDTGTDAEFLALIETGESAGGA